MSLAKAELSDKIQKDLVNLAPLTAVERGAIVYYISITIDLVNAATGPEASELAQEKQQIELSLLNKSTNYVELLRLISDIEVAIAESMRQTSAQTEK